MLAMFCVSVARQVLRVFGKQLFSAKGASSFQAWGNAPGFAVPKKPEALKARLKFYGRAPATRAYSARAAWISFWPWGFAPGWN